MTHFKMENTPGDLIMKLITDGLVFFTNNQE